MTVMAMGWLGKRWTAIAVAVLVAVSAFYLSVAMASVGDGGRPAGDGALPIAAVVAGPVVAHATAAPKVTPMATATATPAAASGWKVNLNAADEATLAKAPGIGKKGAAAIVAYRQRHPFKAAEDLREVEGFTAARCRKLHEHVAVDGPALVGTIPARHHRTKMS